MKPKILKLLPVFLFLLPLGLFLMGTGCDKNETEPDPPEEICDYMLTETDPAKLIIGRWELIKYNDIDIDTIGNPGNMEFREFGFDSLAIVEMYIEEITTKYWLNDSLLHYDHESGYNLTPWYYEFPDNCTLKLRNAFLAFSSFTIAFRRIEQ